VAATLRASWWDLYDSWPFERVDAFDCAVDNFERAWREGQEAPIEPVLAQVPSEERMAWLSELLATEIAVRWQGDCTISHVPTRTCSR
jgi:hypothetical protein